MKGAASSCIVCNLGAPITVKSCGVFSRQHSDEMVAYLQMGSNCGLHPYHFKQAQFHQEACIAPSVAIKFLMTRHTVYSVDKL
jgi:hypothetical protein